MVAMSGLSIQSAMTSDGDRGEGNLSDGLAHALQGRDDWLLLPHGVGLCDKVDGKAGAANADDHPE